MAVERGIERLCFRSVRSFTVIISAGAGLAVDDEDEGKWGRWVDSRWGGNGEVYIGHSI
jgi:hypothetical protein